MLLICVFTFVVSSPTVLNAFVMAEASVPFDSSLLRSLIALLYESKTPFPASLPPTFISGILISLMFFKALVSGIYLTLIFTVSLPAAI